jgi:hypothetical protein
MDLLGSDTGGDCQLEFLGLFKEISSNVSRVEGGSDQDLGLLDQHTIGSHGEWLTS